MKVDSASAAYEPYAQLFRALVPRLAGLSVFDAEAEPVWSTEMASDAEMRKLIGETLQHAQLDPGAPGHAAVLRGEEPVYFFWLRGDAGPVDAAPFAVLVVTAKRGSEIEPRTFAYVHGLLRPAIECLRRELLSRDEIVQLHGSLQEHSQDLDMLLAMSGGQDGTDGSEDDLRGMLRSAVTHLDAGLAALIVPEKGLVLVQPGTTQPLEGALLARAHRHLLSMAQMRRDAVIANDVTLQSGPASAAYRILSCAVGRVDGRTMGVLALFRSQAAPEFSERHARLVELLARRSAAIIASSYDPLTALLTRPAFEQRVNGMLAAASTPRDRWSALYIDVNRLHVINDNFGMHVGDQVLARIGELIRRRLPPGALAARISGDRFAILLPAVLDDAAAFAESLRQGAEEAGAGIGDGSLPVSVSIGVASVEARAREFAHAFAAAETVCKAANDRGRNRVEIYQDSDASIVRRFADVNLLGNLRSAIDRDHLRLYAQAIAPLSGRGGAPYFEILLRMTNENGETLGPDHFLSAALRYQMMPEIDRWVIAQTIERLKPHAALLREAAVVFSINCSGQSLHDEKFTDYVCALVRASGIDPRALTFELTESAAVGNLPQAEQLMRQLQRLGCGIALDDFGTGLSSLAYLRALPITMLKIDGSFVRDVLKDPRAASMIEVIAQLAHSLNMTTVAEYVETEDIRTRVRSLGVDHAQGFAIGRPVPLDEVLAQLPLYAAGSSRAGRSAPRALAAVEDRQCMEPRVRLLLVLLTGVLLGVLLSFGGGVLAERAPAAPPATAAAPGTLLSWEDARLLAEVMQRVRENYVESIDEHAMLRNALRGLVGGLDEHSAFLDREEFAELRLSTSGSYAGIGIEVAAIDAAVAVARRLPGSPAERAGIEPGDVITAIDGAALGAADLDGAVARMRGPVGSPVRLSISPARGGAVRDVVLERAEIELQSVSAGLLAPGYGYLRISSFADTTADEVARALQRLQAPRALRGLVIDLRDNPGGVLEAAVAVADEFLEGGTIVTAHGRTVEARFSMQAAPGDASGGANLGVLVNGGTASAAEILAAALHDNDRAVLIGRRTFGKGSVQTILPLADGEAVKLTTSLYRTPGGVSINGVGIEPDTLLAGKEVSPVDVDVEGAAPTLASRDPDIGLALQALRARERLASRGRGSGASGRDRSGS
ncbi:MAG: EAL domain-containing protein [Gammaproteobacteria bacterium]|nr:EAL domain-containing protein [Gammaproteobacteria bacterium]